MALGVAGMAVLSRSISEGVTVFCWFTPATPVRKAALTVVFPAFSEHTALVLFRSVQLTERTVMASPTSEEGLVVRVLVVPRLKEFV